MSDFYSTLGVSKSATTDEIKSAYKRKVVEWHPDRNKDKEAPDMIKKINKAYEVLSDSQKRSIYDQVGHENYEKRGSSAGASPGQGWPGGGNYQYYSSSPGGVGVDFDFGGGAGIEDIFETFFGGNPYGRTAGRARQKRSVFELTLTFEEAVRGVTKQTVISGKSKDIKIPAGVDDGMRIRFSDFDVIVHVKPHPFFKREGQDLHHIMDIPYTTAVLGGVVRVPLVEGHIDLKVRGGTQSGSVVRLSGKGIPYPNRNQWGDFYVTYRVHVPQRVSAKAKKILEDLQKEISS
ncbi:DnaJ domain-containing protein [Candidatus Woesebacteria bacterium]|nr:DnaJ domain-containing protein [Candidatus Woesebacteria bacterium]